VELISESNDDLSRDNARRCPLESLPVRRRRSISDLRNRALDKQDRPKPPQLIARLDALERRVNDLKEVCEFHSKRNAALQAQLDHLSAKLRLS
jgi:hypothetical protein